MPVEFRKRKTVVRRLFALGCRGCMSAHQITLKSHDGERRLAVLSLLDATDKRLRDIGELQEAPLGVCDRDIYIREEKSPTLRTFDAEVLAEEQEMRKLLTLILSRPGKVGKAAIFLHSAGKFYLWPVVVNERPLKIRFRYEWAIVAAASKPGLGTVHPSYIGTLAQNHPWLWGAFAELIHNALDAGAKNLDITLADEGAAVRLLDDGKGMTPTELQRMLQIGHEVHLRDFFPISWR